MYNEAVKNIFKTFPDAQSIKVVKEQGIIIEIDKEYAIKQVTIPFDIAPKYFSSVKFGTVFTKRIFDAISEPTDEDIGKLCLFSDRQFDIDALKDDDIKLGILDDVYQNMGYDDARFSSIDSVYEYALVANDIVMNELRKVVEYER